MESRTTSLVGSSPGSSALTYRKNGSKFDKIQKIVSEEEKKYYEIQSGKKRENNCFSEIYTK